MSDEFDRELRDWFKRSAEPLPEQPFALTVLERIWRRQLSLRLQRYAALLVAAFSLWLLLPQLSVPLGALAGATGQWPVVAMVVAGLAYMLALRRVRR
jgi:hypothetical protein